MDQVVVARRPKADGVGHAVAQGDTMMGYAGWQIERVAGLQNPLLIGPKVAQDTKFDEGPSAGPPIAQRRRPCACSRNTS